MTGRRTLARALVLLVWLGAALAAPAARAAPHAADSGSVTGLLVTVAATAEDVEGAASGSTSTTDATSATSTTSASAGSSAGGLVLQVWLENQTGREVSGLRVRAAVPNGTLVAASWTGTPDPGGQGGQGAGSADGRAVTWEGLTLAAGGRLGPLAYRLIPAPGADGARVFREAAVRPEVTWSAPAAGVMGANEPPALRLNGLWGEVGLRRTVLPSGLTVFTRERPESPTVALDLAVRAGSRDEDASTCGSTHWLEHAMFLGTQSRPDKQAMIAPLTTAGGQGNARTSEEWTDYYRVVPAGRFDLALDLLSDQILNSAFPPAAFTRERLVVEQEHKRLLDNKAVLAEVEFDKLVFRTSPLGHDPGSVDCLLGVNRDTVVRYRDERYVTGNIAVAAVGNLKHDETVAQIARALDRLPRGAQSDRPRVPEPVQTAPRRLELGEGTRSAEVRLGWPAPADLEADNAAMNVIESVLGNTGRRLAEDLRDRQAIASTISASYRQGSDAGRLMIAAGTSPARVDAVIVGILAQIQRLRDGDVSDQDVQESLHALAGRRALGTELNVDQAKSATGEVSGTLESYQEFVARLRGVTPADVQRAAQRYLDVANYTLVVVRS